MGNLESDGDKLAVYEVGYLVLPSIPEDNLSLVVDAMRKVITKEGGMEIDAEAPIKQPLAYSMTKTIGASRYVLTDAYLGWIKFEVEPAKAPVIQAGIKKISEILRFIMVKAERKTTFTFAKAREVAAPAPEESVIPTPDTEQGAVKEVLI